MAAKISVVLPTFSRRPLLERAIASVMAQDEQDFELIVVDDCSPDDTPQYLATLTDPRLKVVRPQRNGGLSAARNLGIEAANTDVIALLDEDDVYLPERLSRPLSIFMQDSEVVATLSSAERITPKKSQVLAVPEVKMSSAAFEWAVMCMILGPEGTSISFRRKTALEIGGFSSNLVWYEGSEFLMRIARRGAGYLIAEPLWRKYWYANSISSNWATAGPNLLVLGALQPQYFSQYRKLGSYLATKVITADLRYGLWRALWRDLRNFRRAGFIDNNIVRMWQDHLEVGDYRRKMLKPEALAGLTGPPESWN
jgi:glycosyltransferase involved in cell wall biosynthesis